MKQLLLREEHESLNLKAIHALTGDLTGSDPQAMSGTVQTCATSQFLKLESLCVLLAFCKH